MTLTIKKPSGPKMRIKEITIDSRLQTRVKGVIAEKVAEYADSLREDPDLEFDAVEVVDTGKQRILAHGFHRIEAYHLAGREGIPVRVTKGTWQDALVISIRGNQKNGQPLTREDKVHQINLILLDEVLCKESDHSLAKRTGLSQPFVSKYRALKEQEDSRATDNGYQLRGDRTGLDGKERPSDVELQQKKVAKAIQDNPEASNRAIAKELGVSDHTVARVKKKLEEDPEAFRDPVVETYTHANHQSSSNGHGFQRIDLDEDTEEEESEPVDSKGRELPKSLHEIFESATRFRSLIQRIGAMQTEVEELRKTPAGFRLPVSQIKSDLDNAQSGIKLAMPYVLCPDCNGKPKGCEYCKERGWLPEGAWNSMTKKRKEICEGTVKV